MGDTLKITDGPDKPALQWALLYPERDCDVHFKVDGATVDAKIQEMVEQSDGWSFDLRGQLTSGPHKGTLFEGTYSVESRSGSLTIGPSPG